MKIFGHILCKDLGIVVLLEILVKKIAEAIEFEVIESVSGDTLLVADLFTRT